MSYTISAVGTLAYASGVGQTTLNVSPVNVGGILVVGTEVLDVVTVSSISGGGAVGWTRLAGPSPSYHPRNMELWFGRITTAGASTLTLTHSASVAATRVDIGAQEFTSTGGTSARWMQDGAAGTNTGSGATVTFPTLTPAGAGRLYFGYGPIDEDPNTGSPTTGYTRQIDGNNNPWLYNPAVSGAQTPTTPQALAANYSNVAALIVARASADITDVGTSAMVTTAAAATTIAPTHPTVTLGTGETACYYTYLHVRGATRTVTTPTNWTLVGSYASTNTSAEGAGVGPTRTHVYKRVSTTALTSTQSFTISAQATSGVAQGYMRAFKAAGTNLTFDDLALLGWSNPTTGTGGGSATPNGSLTVVAGDFAAKDILQVSVGTADSNTTLTVGSVTCTGATFAAAANAPALVATENGNDMTTAGASVRVTAGANTGTTLAVPVTLNAAEQMHGIVHRIRATADVALTSTLIDNFDDNTVNTTLWPASVGTFSETGGVATVASLTTLSGYGSQGIYTLAGSQVFAKVTPPSIGTATTAFAGVTVYANTTYVDNLRLYVDPAGGITGWFWRVSGVAQWSGNVAYSAVNHAWLRIRETAGTVYFDASPDGVTWSNLGSQTTPAAFASSNNCEVDLESSRNAGTGTAATFDNLNIAGVAIPTGASTGSWSFTGAAAGVRTPKAVGTGSWVFAGAAAGARTPKGAATGSWSFAGAAAGKKTPKGTGTGTWTFVGAAAGVKTPKGTGTGSWAFAGASAGQRTPKAAGTGTWTFTGTAAGQRTPKAAATGTWTFAGAAAGDDPANTGSTTGTWTFAGSAAGQSARAGTGAGTATWVGAATGAAPRSGTATGTLAWAGAAVGTAPSVDSAEGFSTGNWSFAGAAAGAATRRGTSTGTCTFTGAADGTTTRSGVGTGTFTTTGAAAGQSTRRGASTGTTSWTGTATGGSAHSGSGTGTAAWSGLALSGNVRVGATTGTNTWTGSAAGVSARRGNSTGTWVYVGAAAGSTTRRGAATGSWSFTGSAVGATPAVAIPTGTGSGTDTWAGAAAGARASRGNTTGTYAYQGASIGTTQHRGTGSGAWAFTGAAVGMTGLLQFSGTATGTTLWAGAAVGGAPVLLGTMRAATRRAPEARPAPRGAPEARPAARQVAQMRTPA